MRELYEAPTDLMLLDVRRNGEALVAASTISGAVPLVARFFPDGRSVFVAGLAADGTQRWLRVYLDERRVDQIPRPEGIATGDLYSGRVDVSPDGRDVAHDLPDGRVLAIPLDGGAPRPLLTLSAGEQFLGWADTAGQVFVARWDHQRARVYRVTVASGRRDVLHEITVADPAGAMVTPQILVARSGGAYVYFSYRMLGNVYLVEGLR